MKLRSFRTSILLMGLVATMVVALRAADEKSKVKDSDIPAPGQIKFSTAPAAVQKAFNTATKNAKIELLGKGKNESNTTFYNAIVPVGPNNYVMAFAENGQLLEKILNPLHSEVELKDCPPAVQKALREDSEGAEVEAIERVNAGKRSDFIMDIVVKKTRYQVIFTEDGTLMSKVFDDSPEEPAAKDTEKKEPAKSKKK